jgi:hypothetical protein
MSSLAAIGVAHQLPGGIGLAAQDFDRLVASFDRFSRRIDRGSLKVSAQQGDVADRDRPDDPALRFVFVRISSASASRIRSRPTSVSPDRATKRASGSHSSMTASTSPALKGCVN